jgi:hypothetical protein
VDVSLTEDPGPSAVEDRTLLMGNEWHVYTAVLTDDERRARVEYLKTL